MLGMNEYQKLAARTINPKLTEEQTVRHALFGLSAEVGEVNSLFQKELQGHHLELDDLKKEIGDCQWFIAELCTAFGFKMEDIGNMNIEKLKARYPEGFDPEKSIHRQE